MESNSKGAVVAIAAIVGIVVGGLGGWWIADMNMDHNKNSSSMSVSEDKPNSATKAADLRVTLNQAMRQHVTLASVALKASASGDAEAEAAVAALDKNSVEIAGAIGSVYGEQAEKDFLSLWRKHIGFFVDYTNGVVKGDKEMQMQAKADIAGYTEAASTFFSEANPNIDKAEMKKGLEMHGSQVFAIVDAYAAKDYDKAFASEEEAYNHIGVAADNIANAIVKQSPDKF